MQKCRTPGLVPAAKADENKNFKKEKSFLWLFIFKEDTAVWWPSIEDFDDGPMLIYGNYSSSLFCFFRCPFLVFKLCNIFVDLPLFILLFFIYIRIFLGGGV